MLGPGRFELRPRRWVRAGRAADSAYSASSVTVYPACRHTEVATRDWAAGTRIQSVSKVDTVSTGIPASASGLSSRRRIPICENSSAPAARITVNGPSTGPGTGSGRQFVGQITLVSSAVRETLASGAPFAQSGSAASGPSRTTAIACRYWIRCTSTPWGSAEQDRASWGHPRDRQTERLRQVEREVRGLHRPARRAPGEIVDRTDDNHPADAPVHGHLKKGDVRPERIGRARPAAFREQPDEVLDAIGLPTDRLDVTGLDPGLQAVGRG